MRPYLKRLLLPALMLLVIVAIGIFGYTTIEKWSLLDSLYMLVITLFTVGFKEVRELSPAGKVLTMFVIVFGVGSAIYFVGQFGELIIEGQLFGYRRKIRMEKKMKEMKHHYIICGFGRVGHQVAAEFESKKIPYVVIDNKPETAAELEQKGVPYLIGDTTSDEKLKQVGIDKAQGLIACADSDETNVYITLSARALNRNMYIVSRAGSRAVEDKLRIAGANRTISPYFIAGRRMAALATRPVASDFLDMVMHGEHLEFSLREIVVPDRSPLIGRSIAETEIRQRSGATVLAIRRADGGFNLQPLAVSMIEKGDMLIVIGTQEQLDLLDKMVK